MQRVGLVTGGTRGIGRAVSIALRNAGCKVAANYAGNDDAARAFSRETQIPVFRFSVADARACAAGVDAVEKAVGPIEILVNNAGITRDATLHKMSVEDWDTVIATNLSSCFYMSRVVIGGMRGRGFGRIINISSINGQKGQFGQTNYAASKAGIFGFTKSLALENAAKGITVNAVAPGYTETDMVAAVPKDVLAKIAAQIPVGRLATAGEIARAVVFLADDQASFITGATLTVNGGQYMT